MKYKVRGFFIIIDAVALYMDANIFALVGIFFLMLSIMLSDD